MILPARLCHKEQMIDLWNSAFGDKTEDIEKYLETILKYFLVYEEDSIIKGMLSVLPVSFCGKNGGYIYAVTTHKDHRGQGICNKLMEYVKADEKYDFLVLKPQNTGLFEFYGKMGFKKVSQFEKKEICVTPNGKNDYQLKQLSSGEYETARNAYFGENIIKWDSSMLMFAKDMYNGDFYAVENGANCGIAFGYKDKNTVVIKELLAEEHELVANFLANSLGCSKAEMTFWDKKGKDGFMIYPKDMNSGYFNIYFD